jgi:electron transfer flavoprotein beta subunit
MNIIVCIKQVPGTSEVKMDEHGNLIRSGVDSKMNPYDLYAIEAALCLREQYPGGSVNVITMGPPQAAAVVQEAFWMGADDGVLLTDRKFAGADVWATSFALSQGILKMGMPDLIICGKQTTDGDTAQVGAEMAEFLHIPHVTNVINIQKIDTLKYTIVCDIDLPTIVQTIEMAMPCLIAVEKDIYMPRLPSYKKKVATKNKQVKKLALKDLADQSELNYGMNGSPTKVQRVFPPSSDMKRETWKGSASDLTLKLFERIKEKKFV